jgi:pSer/pThr/pTyr-binding forkhead associated (FHA) protein
MDKMNLFLLELLRYIFLFLIYFFIYRVLVTIQKDISSNGNKRGLLTIKSSSCEELAEGEKISFSPPFLIGKGTDNNIKIKNSYLSNEHIRFFLKNGKIWLEDMKSTNGTLLNGKPLKEKQLLRDGDKIDLAGIAILEFRNDYGKNN